MKEKIKTIIIIIAVIFLFWFGATIIRLENYHYATQVGFCDEFSGAENLIQRDQCLNKIQTRTNPIWHLLYGLRIF